MNSNAQLVLFQDDMSPVTTSDKIIEKSHGGVSSGGVIDITDDLSGVWNSEVNAFMDNHTLKSLFFDEEWPHIIADLIAKKISAQPLIVTRKKAVDGRIVTEPLPNHPLQAILFKPNHLQSAIAWMYSTVVDLVMLGNAISWEAPSKKSIIQIPAETVTLTFNELGELESYLGGAFTIDNDIAVRNQPITFPAEEVMHFKLHNPSSFYWGFSPWIAGRRSVLFDRYSQEYLVNFYRRGATPGLFLEMEKAANENNAIRLLRSMEIMHTGRRNQLRPMLLPKGVKVTQGGITIGSQDLREHILLNREKIIALFKVPKHELSIQDSGSLNGDQMDNAVKNFWAATLIPYQVNISGEITRHNREIGVLGENEFVEFDNSNVSILQDDLLKRADLATKMLDTHSPNEIRERLYDDEPIEGGDTLRQSQPQGLPFVLQAPQK